MDKFEAFARAVVAAEQWLCQVYDTTNLSDTDGAPYDFYQQYRGIKQMFEVLNQNEATEREQSYYHAFKKAEDRINKEEYLPHAYIYGQKKEVEDETSPF